MAFGIIRERGGERGDEGGNGVIEVPIVGGEDLGTQIRVLKAGYRLEARQFVLVLGAGILHRREEMIDQGDDRRRIDGLLLDFPPDRPVRFPLSGLYAVYR